MAAASELVDRAVRTKGTQERVRGKAGGAHGHETRSEAHAREAIRERWDREAGKLDEGERAELLYLWSGAESAIGARSAHGAIQDQLLRAPPRIGEALEREVVLALGPRGAAGWSRDRLVELLAAENVGATRYEGRLALRRMVGAGKVEFFKANELRKKPCVCKSPLGEYEGVSQGSPGSPFAKRECHCDAGTLVEVMVEMVRLAPGKHLRLVGPAVRPEVRWAKADEELESFCRQLSVGESSRGSRASDGPSGGGSRRSDRTRSALARSSHKAVRILERAYGQMANPDWSGLSHEAARLAVLCEATERARRELVTEKLRGLGKVGNEDARRAVDRATHAPDALRWRLDAQPEDALDRIRWKVAREHFVAAVEKEAGELLAEAVEEYREARGNG